MEKIGLKTLLITLLLLQTQQDGIYKVQLLSKDILVMQIFLEKFNNLTTTCLTK